jgi:hypothetical protein
MFRVGKTKVQMAAKKGAVTGFPSVEAVDNMGDSTDLSYGPEQIMTPER